MTTLNAANTEQIAHALTRAQVAVFATRLALGVLTWLVVSLGIWLALFGLDNILQLPAGLRFPLAIAAAVLTLGVLWRCVLKPVRGWLGADRVAVMLERQYGIAGNLLINSLQFGQGEYSETQQAFIEETIRTGSRRLAAVNLRDLWQIGRVGKWSLVGICLLATWAAYVLLAPRQAQNALARYVFSLSDVPPAGSITLKVTPATDITISQRDDLQVSVEISDLKPGERLSAYPELFWKEGESPVAIRRGDGTRVVMQPVVGQANLYAYTFKEVPRGFTFRLFAGDTYSRSTFVHVLPAPKIIESQFALTPPPYTGLGTARSPGPPHPVAALAGAQLDIEIGLDQPAEGMRWRAMGRVTEFRQEGNLWRARTLLSGSGPYEIEVDGKGLRRPVLIATGSITLLTDRAPTVEFVSSSRSQVVTPGQKLSLSFRAEDDYGLRDLGLIVRPAYGGSTPQTLRTWTFPGPPGQKSPVTQPYLLSIDASAFAPGGKYFILAQCRDFCPGNEPGMSRPILLTVRTMEELAAMAGQKLDGVHEALDRAIRFQKDALDGTRSLATHLEDVWLDLARKPRPEGDVRTLLNAHRGLILRNQVGVFSTLRQAWQTFQDNPSPLLQRMKELGSGEAVEANDKAYAFDQPDLSLGNLQPIISDGMLPATGKPHTIRFAATSARYACFALLSPHTWNDSSEVGPLTFLGPDGKPLPTKGWRVVSCQPTAANEGRTVQNVLASADRLFWQPLGRLPYCAVVDMGARQELAGLICAGARGANLRARRFCLYLSEAPIPEPRLVGVLDKNRIADRLSPLEKTQETLYNELVALKGREAAKAQQAHEEVARKALGEEGLESAPSVEEKTQRVKEQVKEWLQDHKENAQRRSKLMDKPAEDLTQDDKTELADLIQEKREQARDLKDIVNDLDAMAGMDFADAKTAKTVAEMKEKGHELAEMEDQAAKKAEEMEFTINLDTAIMLKAEELTAGPDEKTHGKELRGSMEAQEDQQAPAVLPQIPDQIKSEITELAKKQEDLSSQIEQAGTQLISFPSGEGPPVAGAYSSTSASGKLSDIEIDPMKPATGRSGAGRSGQADGQIVGDSAPAIPDDKAAMPPRMTNTPLEGGAPVKDEGNQQATSDGLGKGTDKVDQFALTGKLPPQLLDRLRTVLGEEERLRTSAQELVLTLERHNLPSTDLKMAALRMQQISLAIKKGDGVGIRQACDEAIERLNKSRESVAEQIEIREAARAAMQERLTDSAGGYPEAPAGYENIVGEYFKRLAESHEGGGQ
ncbi:MAG: hypothetical protein BWX88_02297 [Planctomycetes bacterium ADurb.Bin126]|nr:MAG: hypothetical protein BWX88_02297 [Planctomycetes bacterium ADurb.Bin126]HOD81353.1 hypothetical protein [Phycisphaerae bacterium]HQL73788.1 hypothetical protein [Phycisphaerae bacterium]